MKVALVNPPWRFERSIYFGCAEAHLPLEFGYARARLEAAGHHVSLLDAHLLGMGELATVEAISDFAPDFTVVTTAPTYLFWRCPPPELRVPASFVRRLSSRGGKMIAVGPHGSATPQAVLRKLGVDVVVRGECEDVIAEIVAAKALGDVKGIAFRGNDGEVVVTGGPRATRFTDEAALRWEQQFVDMHHHHHHRFDGSPEGPGAEVEASRGCPFACTFCAKLDFRDGYRRRDRGPLLEEVDGLLAQGVRYIYFIDEIFLPDRALLEALAARNVAFGVQTRIDLWKPDLLELLGRAGCVSIEAGVESLRLEGRAQLAKKCRLDTGQITELLVHARRFVPFVQANLILSEGEDLVEVAHWRETLRRHGVWANDPVPLFPYPSSPDYHRLFGPPDDEAWERAHAYYLGNL